MERLLNWLLPRACLCCGVTTCAPTNICNDCHLQLPFIQRCCSRCGVPLANTQPYCGHCLRHPPPYAAVHALFHYQSPIRHFTNQLKFHNQLLYGASLGLLLAKHVQRKYAGHPLPDCLVPMPLHTQRLKKRGYNQALIIAKPISRLLNIPIDQSSWHRIKPTAAQASLPARLRANNVKRSFQYVGEQPAARHIAIIDDIMTTGSTVTALSQTMRQAGAERIEIWCLARTTIYL